MDSVRPGEGESKGSERVASLEDWRIARIREVCRNKFVRKLMVAFDAEIVEVKDSSYEKEQVNV